MSLTAILIGAAACAGWLGELPETSRFSAGALALFLGCFGFYHGVRNRKPIHIDISDKGQIRLTDVIPKRSCANGKWPHVAKNNSPVRLLTGSTLWSQLLLLRLERESGEVLTIPIMPDSVSRDSFRALSVACRWIAEHRDQANRMDF